jgi:hypothetical protein
VVGLLQEAPDNASVHEAPTEDVVDNDEDLVKDAKKVYKPFASVHHYADCAIASVTCPLHMNFLVQTNVYITPILAAFMPAQLSFRDLEAATKTLVQFWLDTSMV